MHTLRTLLVAFVLFVSTTARAWDKQDFNDELLSPFTTDAKYVAIGGTLLTLATVAWKDQRDGWHKSQVQRHSMGHASHYGDLLGQLLPNIAYVVGQGVAHYYGNTKAERRAWNMIKATAYTGGVVTVLKYTVQQERPDKSTRNSFPSGHSSTAFAFAGHVLEEHGWAWGSASLAMASFVGYSRIQDNRHYLQDVVAGATIGLAYGIGITQLDGGKGDGTGVSIVPVYDRDLFGLFAMSEF